MIFCQISFTFLPLKNAFLMIFCQKNGLKFLIPFFLGHPIFADLLPAPALDKFFRFIQSGFESLLPPVFSEIFRKYGGEQRFVSVNNRHWNFCEFVGDNRDSSAHLSPANSSKNSKILNVFFQFSFPFPLKITNFLLFFQLYPRL